MRLTNRLQKVQTPIIPVIANWTRQTPGTLSLGQGMVSYPPPDAAMQAISAFGGLPEQHLYGSPLGHPPLLDLIRAKLRRENSIDVDRAYQVMVTAGSNMAFLNTIMAISDPGDEIILPTPYYFNQEMAIEMLGCVTVPVLTREDYQLDLNALQEAITTKTRAIVTVSPNNPSGAVYPEADLRAVNRLCKQHGIFHISDEAYEYFTYGGAAHFSPASLDDAAEHTISLYSLSKAYGFASWRVGYAVFPEALLASMLKIQDTNLICPPLITQIAAMGALEVGAEYCRQKLPELAQIRQQVLQQLQSITEMCEVQATSGAFYLLLKVHTPMRDLELAERLIKAFKVAAIPGSAFGMQDGCYLRISYGMLNREQSFEAITRLVTGLQVLCR
ncbi:pyridoxal phosphate-dependent aminotransferase [Methylomonas koyamae]|uniref:pyridoxal phosphate-dependent aminotransferase n=1 Tax=Methylomonas koyamae TaxID=702114 RepID=UPI002873201C|nr:pyridoxal phosphate-dependent aminotransferase [Methylomonas koyamae]WNB76754.1 pyridoxal phosphate-dependent aminotransferase [Methylomonas koyamae]